MRAVRALIALAAVLLVLAVAALWLVPSFLDWNRYREDIERLAATVLDRPVLIEGPITLRLLPQPMLTASAVRIAGGPEQGTFSARELSLRLGPAALLGGHVDAREVVLRGADLELPWPLPANALPVRRPGWLAGLSASIENGRIGIGAVHVDAVNATLTVSGPIGGYQAAGAARLYGRTWRVTAHLGPAGADNAAPLELSVGGAGPLQGTELTFSGQVSPDGAGGRLTAKGRDLALLMPAPRLPFSAEGRLTIASGLAAADDLALVIGAAPARGALSLRVAPSLRVDLAIAASRLELDPWLPVLLTTQAASYPVGLDLSTEAAQLAGGLVRRLRVASELDHGRMLIRDASAILPGEATLRLSGRIMAALPKRTGSGPVTLAASTQGRPHFEGKVAVAAPDLRATLRWLDPTGHKLLDALPAGVLRSMNVTAKTVVEPDRVALSGLSGSIDESRIEGDLSLALGPEREQAPVAVHADLHFDRLDLDPWLPESAPSVAAVRRLLPTLDADLRLKVGQATIRGVGVNGLVLDGTATGGRLAVRALQGQALGVDMSLSGAVDASGQVSGARFAVATEDATAIADRLPPAWRAGGGSPGGLLLWRAPLHATIEADGPANALKLSAHAVLGASALDATTQVDLGTAKGSGSVAVTNPDASRLLQSAGLGTLAAWLGDGPLRIEAQLDVAPDRVGVDGLRFDAGVLRSVGQLSVDRSGEQPRIVGRITAETLPLPPVDPRAPNPLPLDFLGGWEATIQLSASEVLVGAAGGVHPLLEQAAGTLSVGQHLLRLEGLEAKTFGGTLAATATLDAAEDAPRLMLQATLADAAIGGPLTGLPLDVIGGHAGGEVALTAAGHSPAAMLATLGGHAQVSIRDGALSGFSLGGVAAALRSAPGEGPLEAALTTALESGRTDFGQLDFRASAARGVLDVAGSMLQSADGGAAFTGNIDVPDATLDLHAAIHPALPEAPDIGLRLTGPAGSPRHMPELADVTRWRVQHVRAP